jgi:hypothetical protein
VGMVAHTCNLSTWGAKQKACEFGASLTYMSQKKFIFSNKIQILKDNSLS